MPETSTAGPFPLEGVNLETWLIRFDKKGNCISPQTQTALINRLAEKPNAPIIFYSHGWNNDFSDAKSRYAGLLTQLLNIAQGARALPGDKPIFVGITWPSTWFPSDSGPQLASASAAGASNTETESVLDALRDVLPPNTDFGRLRTLANKQKLTLDEARELARLIIPALNGDVDGATEAKATEDSIIRSMRSLQRAEKPKQDDSEFGEARAVGDAVGGITAAGFLSLLDPRPAIRMASVYIMKDRAGVIGEKGTRLLLDGMLKKSQAPIYLVGHSYGCKVMLSALSVPRPLHRKVQGLLLLQPAISHLCFAGYIPGVDRPGGYVSVLDRVVNPIFTTYSAHDSALYRIFHLALLRDEDIGEMRPAAAAADRAGPPPSKYAALGGYGPRSANELLLHVIPAPGEAIDTIGKRLVAFDGSFERRISGHGDVSTKYTAWLLYKQMTWS